MEVEPMATSIPQMCFFSIVSLISQTDNFLFGSFIKEKAQVCQPHFPSTNLKDLLKMVKYST